MANSLYEMGLQGIMVVVFIKANIHSKVMITTRCIPWSSAGTSHGRNGPLPEFYFFLIYVVDWYS